MLRLLHLLPIIVLISVVTASLRAKEPRGFTREFLKAAASLGVGFVALAALVLLAGLYL